MFTVKCQLKFTEPGKKELLVKLDYYKNFRLLCKFVLNKEKNNL